MNKEFEERIKRMVLDLAVIFRSWLTRRKVLSREVELTGLKPGKSRGQRKPSG